MLGRTLLNVERLEDIEATGSLLPMAASALGAAALVRTVDLSSQTPALEKPSGIADAAMDAPTEQAKALSDKVFRQLAAQPSPSMDHVRFLAAADQSAAVDDTEPKPTAHDAALDPVMAAVNALVDPVAHPDTTPANGTKTGPHHPAPPAGNSINGNSPNLAGANAGAGQ